MKTLFINACVRENSRTLILAKEVMKKIEGEIVEVNLEKENLSPLTKDLLSKRDVLLREGRLDDLMLSYAREFAAADNIVIAAPFWDLSFPSLLKVYLEQITVVGVTFEYQNGIPRGLCRAKRLTYVTTAGGMIVSDFGYSYVKALANNFYGIKETEAIRAMNLDVEGITHENFLRDARITVEK